MWNLFEKLERSQIELISGYKSILVIVLGRSLQLFGAFIPLIGNPNSANALYGQQPTATATASIGRSACQQPKFHVFVGHYQIHLNVVRKAPNLIPGAHLKCVWNEFIIINDNNRELYWPDQMTMAGEETTTSLNVASDKREIDAVSNKAETTKLEGDGKLVVGDPRKSWLSWLPAAAHNSTVSTSYSESAVS